MGKYLLYLIFFSGIIIKTLDIGIVVKTLDMLILCILSTFCVKSHLFCPSKVSFHFNWACAAQQKIDQTPKPPLHCCSRDAPAWRSRAAPDRGVNALNEHARRKKIALLTRRSRSETAVIHKISYMCVLCACVTLMLRDVIHATPECIWIGICQTENHVKIGQFLSLAD